MVVWHGTVLLGGFSLYRRIATFLVMFEIRQKKLIAVSECSDMIGERWQRGRQP
jgi:hypothetical protein